MAENEAAQHDRTEPPTQKRLDDARRRGQVPRSRELSMTAVVIAGAAVFLVAGIFRPGKSGSTGEPLRSWA
jgi:flagellar biosynthetic protein FlhB